MIPSQRVHGLQIQKLALTCVIQMKEYTNVVQIPTNTYKWVMEIDFQF